MLLGLLWTHKKVHLSTIRNGRQPGDGLDMVGQGFSLALHDDFKLGDPISLMCWWSTISIHGRLATYCYVKCHKDAQLNYFSCKNHWHFNLQKWHFNLQATLRATTQATHQSLGHPDHLPLGASLRPGGRRDGCEQLPKM